MQKEIIHSLVLIFSIGLSFIFPKTNLAHYDLQIAALLFIILYLSKKFFILSSPSSRLLESVVFTIVIVSVINSTGGLASPFFFLTQFLLFSLALLLEPIISITSTLTLIIFFLIFMPANQDIKSFLPLISLAFITPFAMFLGQEYLQNEKLKKKNQDLKENTFLFLSLMLKNHLKEIKKAIENFIGDHELYQIKKHAQTMEKLIDKFEKNN
ncbi:MAG: hypothetical protein N2482_03315 [Patescibacteria group bacterium]|nr:hypothetical protein [Patescibacteria group bacterium]